MLRSLLVHESPLPPGSPAPALSLTGDDGQWVQSRDYLDARNLVLVFSGDPTAEPAATLLRDLVAAAPRIEELETLVFGVCQDRPDKLRLHKERLGVDLVLLYDLLAMSSRRFRQSGRRPYVREGVVVIDKQGNVAAHLHPPYEADAIVQIVRDLEGVPAPEAAGPGVRFVDWDRATRLLRDQHTLVDVRTEGEFVSLHVPGAVHITVEDLPQRFTELSDNARVITVCQTGDRSRPAAEFLVGVGFVEVYCVLGGMAAWPGGPSST